MHSLGEIIEMNKQVLVTRSRGGLMAQRVEGIKAKGGGSLICSSEDAAKSVVERFGGIYERWESQSGRSLGLIIHDDGLSEPYILGHEHLEPIYTHTVKFGGDNRDE